MRKRKKKKEKLSKRYLFLGFLILVFPIILIITSSQKTRDNKTYATGLGKDLYGIAAGDALENLNTTDLNHYMDDTKALGKQWVRFDFDWAVIQAGGPTSYNWTAFDAAVTAANARGIKVLGIIDFTPQWELASGCTDSYWCPPKSSADYATFAATLASHYAPMGVHTWEIWNEPNMKSRFTLPGYTALLKAAYPAIKNADPSSFILTGGTAPVATDGTNISSIDFLTGIYQNGGKGYFDAVAHHPYCWGGGPTFNCPTTYAYWSGWSEMQDTNPSLRSVMTANGDQNKKIWATEFGAPTGGGSAAYSESQQAQMVTDAYTLFNSYSWSGPLFWYSYKDTCTTATDTECFFGLVHTDYSQKPAFAVYKNLATNTTSGTVIPTFYCGGSAACAGSTSPTIPTGQPSQQNNVPSTNQAETSVPVTTSLNPCQSTTANVARSSKNHTRRNYKKNGRLSKFFQQLVNWLLQLVQKLFGSNLDGNNLPTPNNEVGTFPSVIVNESISPCQQNMQLNSLK